MEKVSIFHLNDLHSHLEMWPRISSYLLSKREEAKHHNDTFFAFDLGDAVDREHPLMEATGGQAMTRLLNAAKIDGATIGNNEGIGSTKEQLDQLYASASFPVILGNLVDIKTGKKPNWAVPFRLYRTNEGTTIGVLGVTVPLNVSYEPLGWHAEDPFRAVEKVLSVYKDLADVLILLSHVGYSFDLEIARRHPELDVVIGAHTHHVLPRGERIGDTLIAAAGKFGEYVGEITLELEKGHVLSSTAKVRATGELPEATDEKKWTDQYELIGHQLLSEEEVTILAETFQIDWNQCGELVQLGLQAMMDYSRTEAGMLNAGLFLRPLLSGIVTRNDLHEMLPHPMRIAKVSMSGERLLLLLQDIAAKKEELEHREIAGIGFRGKVMGKICFSGIQYEELSDTWFWNEKKIRPDQLYTFATVDHFIFADYFPLLHENEKIEILFPYFLRDVLAGYLKKNHNMK